MITLDGCSTALCRCSEPLFRSRCWAREAVPRLLIYIGYTAHVIFGCLVRFPPWARLTETWLPPTAAYQRVLGALSLVQNAHAPFRPAEPPDKAPQTVKVRRAGHGLRGVFSFGCLTAASSPLRFWSIGAAIYSFAPLHFCTFALLPFCTSAILLHSIAIRDGSGSPEFADDCVVIVCLVLF